MIQNTDRENCTVPLKIQLEKLIGDEIFGRDVISLMGAISIFYHDKEPNPNFATQLSASRKRFKSSTFDNFDMHVS